MAFIRVVADVRIEFVDVYRNSITKDNVEVATGSGFVIAPSGLVLTNHHVIDDTPESRRIEGHDAEVRLENRRIVIAIGPEGSLGDYDAWVVTSDPDLDLAVLQVTAADLPYIPFGDSDAAEPGQGVKVLGFPFGRQVDVGRSRPGPSAVPRTTVTSGSLSAARPDDAGATRYLQTDASVNPGSSGGPMVNEEGYAVGVVKMKLARGARAQGAGFGVPINLVKDYLEAQGLLGQLPVERLYPGVVHTLDWKKLRLELPDGFADESPARLFVDTADSSREVSVQVARLATPWDDADLQAALLKGSAWRGFAPAPVEGHRVTEQKGRVLGSGRGTREDGSAFRVEYTVLDLGSEKVVARYLGTPDELAFNLSLVRRSLETLEAAPLLTDEVDAPLAPLLEAVAYPGAATGSVPLPLGWSREPATASVCGAVPPAETGLQTSPAGDFTVALRVLRWPAGAIVPDQVARSCGGATGAGGSTYSGRFDRLGVTTGVWGAFVEQSGEVLLLEAEAPETKQPFLRELYAGWTRRLAEGR